MGIKKFVKKIVAILITLFIVLIYAVGEPKMQKYALVLMAIYTVMAVIYWIKQVRFETVIFIISTIVIFGILTVILPSSKDKNSVIKTDKIILSKKGTLYREMNNLVLIDPSVRCKVSHFIYNCFFYS